MLAAGLSFPFGKSETAPESYPVTGEPQVLLVRQDRGQRGNARLVLVGTVVQEGGKEFDQGREMANRLGRHVPGRYVVHGKVSLQSADGVPSGSHSRAFGGESPFARLGHLFRFIRCCIRPSRLLVSPALAV